MIVSFAHTTAALLAGAKSVTRREDWQATHAEHFRAGMLVDAWDRLPRVKGAERIGAIRVTKAPYRQRSDRVTPDDWYREGFAWMQAHGSLEDMQRAHNIWTGWKEHPVELWVLEFELVSTVCPACSAVVRGPLGLGSTGLRCCQHCSLNARGCRCAAGVPRGRVGLWDLDDAEIRRLEEALDR